MVSIFTLVAAIVIAIELAVQIVLSFLLLKTALMSETDIVDKYSDNGLSNDNIQAILNVVLSKGYDPDITTDNEGHRWISVQTKDGKNAFNLVRIDSENFGPNASFDKVEKKVINIIDTKLKDFLSSFGGDKSSAEAKKPEV